eukprot:6150953-Pyramimonas_sp.AAC.1
MIPNANKGCCVIHRCDDQPRAKTRSLPIENPRNVLRTPCASTCCGVQYQHSKEQCGTGVRGYGATRADDDRRGQGVVVGVSTCTALAWLVQ